MCYPLISFEGAPMRQFPVVVHGLERGDVSHPLTSLQIRSLQNLEDADAPLNRPSIKAGVGQSRRLSLALESDHIT